MQHIKIFINIIFDYNVSKTSRGNYYKNKTRDWFIKKGYKVELCEFLCGIPIGGGKIVFKKRDVLASDGIAYNDNEFILWNSKHYTNDKQSIKNRGKQYAKNYNEIKTPSFIKKQIIIWELRKKEPMVIDC